MCKSCGSAACASVEAMTKEELYANPRSEWCTSKGREALLIALETTFREARMSEKPKRSL
jgi:hypothetical protein